MPSVPRTRPSSHSADLETEAVRMCLGLHEQVPRQRPASLHGLATSFPKAQGSKLQALASGVKLSESASAPGMCQSVQPRSRGCGRWGGSPRYRPAQGVLRP